MSDDGWQTADGRWRFIKTTRGPKIRRAEPDDGWLKADGGAGNAETPTFRLSSVG